MAADDARGTRSNLPCAVAFAALVVAAFLGAPRVEALGPTVPYAVLAVTIVLAPLALIWVVGEMHLRWSPRGRVARGVVGWTLVAATLALLVVAAPVGLYLLLASAAAALGW